MEFQLTPAECSQLLPSGVSTIIRNRTGWARSYLKQAGLIEYPQRGIFSITPRGLEILKSKVTNIFIEE
ncbi:MAG: winged helix-turn-helix domain-containing protein [Deltaproteobacteria bacterium]|nr:MAG: winged helix-turn-helix domain-containing protein [Deltaproteobacteria bacterium]